MTRRHFRTAALALCAVAAAATETRAATPAWLQQAAAGANRASAAHATVLLDELSVTVEADGKAKTTRHYAVRVHDRAGREAAMIREVYVSGSGSVRSMHGWLLRQSVEPRELGSANMVDAALVGNDVYNEVRVRALSAADDVAAGDVFGAEVESEERLLFAQFEWTLQDRWPVAIARRLLTLPERWHARAVTFNSDLIAPRSNGRTLSWEITNLAEIPDEPAMPPLSSLVPRLVVSMFGDNRDAANGQFDTWQDVSRWLDTISHDQPASNAIAEKARTLTVSARTELDRIAAIGQYVQHVQYVSIQTGIGRGGGYQPHPSAVVLERNYGDCKDKAGLMRALLAAAGIKAYIVSIYSGDRDYVRPDWPSPQQFNHAIVAISVQPETMASVVVEHPSLGRLLLFDPTDEYTPVGDLPLDEQGSLALVISPRSDALTKVPIMPRENNRLDRSLDGAISIDGALAGRMQEQSQGARASQERAAARALNPTTYRTVVERRVSAAVPGVVVSNLSGDASTGTAPFAVAFDVAAPHFAQQVGSLLLVKFPLGLDDSSSDLLAARTSAIVVEPQLTNETIRLKLPVALAVDEIPDSVSFDGPFGRYSLSYSTADGALVAHRVFELQGQTIGAARQGELRAFLTRAHAADVSPVVLKK
jgi:transglutaminase-like putative cysteine protease